MVVFEADYDEIKL